MRSRRTNSVKVVGGRPSSRATSPVSPAARAAADPAAARGDARRHRVENLWARLKEWRALATRYDKTASSFLGALHLAASLDWLHNGT